MSNCDLLLFIKNSRLPFKAHVNWVQPELLRVLSSVPADLTLSVLIYVTSEPSPSSSATHTLHDHASDGSRSSHDDLRKDRDMIEKDCDIVKDVDVEKGGSDEKASPAISTQAIDDLTEQRGVSFFSGKPNFHKILEEAVTSSDGPVSVDGECSMLSIVRHIKLT